MENPEKSNPNPPNLREPSGHGPGAVRGGRFPFLETPCPTQTGISPPLVFPGLSRARLRGFSRAFIRPRSRCNHFQLNWSHVTSRHPWAAHGSGCSRCGATPSLNNPLAAQRRDARNSGIFSQRGAIRAIPVFPPGSCLAVSFWDRLGFSLQLWEYPSPSPNPDSGLPGGSAGANSSGSRAGGWN